MKFVLEIDVPEGATDGDIGRILQRVGTDLIGAPHPEFEMFAPYSKGIHNFGQQIGGWATTNRKGSVLRNGINVPHRATDEYAAHNMVEASRAGVGGIDWPVSGDETGRRYGLAGRQTGVQLWKSPGVVPKIATTGIRVGDRIETWYGEGVVTRVGTIAGWFILDGEVEETRWEISEIEFILPAESEGEEQ